jgi:hypothetical protein
MIIPSDSFWVTVMVAFIPCTVIAIGLLLALVKAVQDLWRKHRSCRVAQHRAQLSKATDVAQRLRALALDGSPEARARYFEMCDTLRRKRPALLRMVTAARRRLALADQEPDPWQQERSARGLHAENP